MKKFVAGIVVGLLISLTTTAFGAAGLIGAKIEKVMSVSLDGKSVGTAVVTGGVSYLPVRAVADALDLEAEVSKGGIILSSNAQDLASIAKQEQSELDANTAEFNRLNQAHYLLLRSEASQAKIVTNMQGTLVVRQQAKVDTAPTPEAKAREQRYLDILLVNLETEKQNLEATKADLAVAAAALDDFVIGHPEFKEFITKINP
ncbi:hypothetical protein M3223_04030 [Paenibacillus pasadenensis]|uniref:hypothetical protein n=1 Tax=Paenibacillus pasadenensis TaxID=217090 RepID=UPI00204103D5|nr:hypothetical protein [Paenibacillus pasadenensis]MCM3746517.1 hypothetical protein [Paenibacillus pasadenensis]